MVLNLDLKLTQRNITFVNKNIVDEAPGYKPSTHGRNRAIIIWWSKLPPNSIVEIAIPSLRDDFMKNQIKI